MSVLLLLLAIAGGVAGLLFLSAANVGVGVIGFACLLGIVALYAQASEQHKWTMEAIGRLETTEPTAESK